MVTDDAALFRAGVSRLLGDAGFEVTAQVGDAAALLDAADRAGLPAREADRTLRSALRRTVAS